MKKSRFLTFALYIVLSIPCVLFAQFDQLKKSVSEDEVEMLRQVAEEIANSDQLYRGYLSAGTLDDDLIDRIDSVFNNVGIEEGFKYQTSLNLSLSPEVKDSLWQLQHVLDLNNHLRLRGLLETYGFLPKELLGKYHYCQIVLLLHPPKDWDIEQYLSDYSEIYKEEIQAGRVEPKTFASFYDNMKCKIMKEPQLYGTNLQFDPKTGTTLPPDIEDLAKSNAARVEIGMSPLKEGEYRLLSGN